MSTKLVKIGEASVRKRLLTSLIILTLSLWKVGIGYAQIITTFAGDGLTTPYGDGGQATSAELISPYGIVLDAAGNLYITENTNQRVRKVTPAGIISTYAGTGAAGFSGDGGQATAAQLNGPIGIAIDAAGNFYIADENNYRIRKVTTAGIISTIAGNGTNGYSGDGGAATAAELGTPTGVIVTAAGIIYIADNGNQRIRQISTTDIITTIAGNGTAGFSGDGGQATGAELSNPSTLALDAGNNLYIADKSNNRIRKITTAGIISTIAGNGTAGYSGDGGAATGAELNVPNGVVLDAAGNVYIADNTNDRIRKITTAGIISTIAGNGIAGFSGDGGTATSAELHGPARVAVDATNNIYIADVTNNRIRKVNTAGIIKTIVGNGLTSPIGDGGQATGAELNLPQAAIFDAAGNLFIADVGSSLIRKITTAGIITTIAGNGVCCGFSGDGGQATAAQLYNPVSIALDGTGNLYIADEYNQRIRKVTTAGIISTIAGNGTLGFSGDGGAATAAEFNYPLGMVFDGAGNLYIADSQNQRIRKVTTAGIISTIAGTGTGGYSGDGGAATAAEINWPWGLAIHPPGNLYMADNVNNRVRMINSSGIITTVAGNGTNNYSGDGAAATAAELNGPVGVVFDAANNLYIADNGNNRIRKIITTGIISTYAGNGTVGFSGDGGQATAAELNAPHAVTFDALGNLYISDDVNNRIRKVTPSPTSAINSYSVSESSPTICAGQTATIQLSGSQTGVFYGVVSLADTNAIIVGPVAGTGNTLNFVVSPSVTITYGVAGVIVGTQTLVMTPFVTITVNPLPTVFISAGSDTVCNNTTDVLTAFGNAGSYVWSVGTSTTTSNPLTVAPLVTTTYTVTGKNDTTGCTNTATHTIQVLNCGCPVSINLIGIDSITSSTIANGDSIFCSNGPFTIRANQPPPPVTDSINDIYTPCIEAIFSPYQTALGNNGTLTVYEGVVDIECLGSSTACISKIGGPTPPPSGHNWATYISYLDYTKPHSFVFSTSTSISTTTVTLKSCWTNQVFTTYTWNATGASTHSVTIPTNTNIGKSTFSMNPPSTLPNTFTDFHNGNCVIHPHLLGSGIYTVTYIFSDTLCHGDSLSYSFNIIRPDVNWIPPLLCINSPCVNLTNQLDSLALTGGVWSGAPGILSPTGTFCPPNTAGNYNVVYTAGTATCGASQTHTITISNLPTLTVNSDTICPGDSAVLLVKGASTYIWSPVVSLSNQIDSFVIASPTVTTIYTVIGTDILNCKNTTTSTITISNSANCSNSVSGALEVHNAFSPNGDGLNDLFIIDNIGEFPNNHVYIYNRWGQLLWNKASYNNNSIVWDGKSGDGSSLYAGTYYYIVEKAGPKSVKGWVELTK
jgi:gliding motility-associated-like protein